MRDTPPLDLREVAAGVVFRIRVQPKASRDGVIGLHARALKVGVTAPPAEGAANDACIGLLSRLLKVPKGRVHIVRGARSRDKWIEIRGVSRDRILNLLEQLQID
jgi:uncharacterized protein